MATSGARYLYGGVISWNRKKILAGFVWTIGGFFCGLSLAISAGFQCIKVSSQKLRSSNKSSYNISTLGFFTLIGLGSAIAHISIILIPGLILYLLRDLLTPVWVILILIGIAFFVEEFTSGRNKVIVKIFGEKAERRRMNMHRPSHAKSSETEPPIDLKEYFGETPAEITESAIDNVFGNPNTSNRQKSTRKKEGRTRSRHLSADEANKKLEQIKSELEENN